MTKNIEKARARPQAATGPYAPARMSTVKTELRVAGLRGSLGNLKQSKVHDGGTIIEGGGARK